MLWDFLVSISGIGANGFLTTKVANEFTNEKLIPQSQNTGGITMEMMVDPVLAADGHAHLELRTFCETILELPEITSWEAGTHR